MNSPGAIHKKEGEGVRSHEEQQENTGSVNEPRDNWHHDTSLIVTRLVELLLIIVIAV